QPACRVRSSLPRLTHDALARGFASPLRGRGGPHEHDFPEFTGAVAPARRRGGVAALRAPVHAAAVLLGARGRPADAGRRGPRSRSTRGAGAKTARVLLRPAQELPRLAADDRAEQVARALPPL